MKTKALGEICRPKQWKTVSVSQLCENGYPVYGANGVIGKYKDFNHKKETILVTCRGATCGTLNICAPFSYVNGNAMALDSLDKSVDLRYLYYFLKGRGFHDVISGSAQPQIIRSAIERIEVPICNIGTQKEITKRFTKIEDIIKNKKRLLADLDNLIKARFVEMFKDEDPVFAFDDVLIDDTKNGFKLDSSNYSNLGKIAIVDQGQKRICGYINAVDGKAPWSKEAIIFGDHTEMFKYINFPFYLGADGTKLLSPKNGWNTRFLYHYLDINYHKRLGYMRHFKYLKEMSFIKPDLDRQEEFCMFCTQVDKSKFALQNSIISLMNLWYNIN